MFAQALFMCSASSVTRNVLFVTGLQPIKQLHRTDHSTITLSRALEMDASPLAKLAGELRNQIYELLLHEPQGFAFRYNADRDHKNEWQDIRKTDNVRKDKHFLAITEVCRQIRKESLPFFYHINSFTQPMRFWQFGSRMGKFQMQRYGLRLKHARKWLKAIGTESSNAISHFELYLGEWRNTDRPASKDREWRTMARRLERKQLLPMLQQSSIFVSMTLFLREPDCSFHIICKVGGATTWWNCHTVKFTLPDNQEKARGEIERTYREKLEELEGHIDHQGCKVVGWLPGLCVDLRRCRDLMMHTVDIKTKEAEDGGSGEKTLTGALRGLQVG